MTVLLTIGLVLGLLLGVLGGGGSILTVPALVYAAGLPPKAAIATSLAVVGITSAVGAARQWSLGTVQPRKALGFAVATMAGAFAGGLLAGFVRGDVQLVGLAVVMLASAASMWRPARLTPGDPRPAVLLAAGVGVGVLTGIVGIGGGFLIVPALTGLAAFPMPQAVGTSLVVIALNSAAAFAAQAGSTAVPWREAAVVTAGAVAGVLGGSAVGRRLSPAQLRRGFAIFLVVLAGFMLWTNRATLQPGGASAPRVPPPSPPSTPRPS